MALTPSQRPTREWPRLIIAVFIVGLVIYPFYQYFATPSEGSWLYWQPKRWAELLLGPEQLVCYACFVWGVLIFIGRYREVRRQRWAFKLALLPTEEGARILQEDARPCNAAWISSCRMGHSSSPT